MRTLILLPKKVKGNSNQTGKRLKQKQQQKQRPCLGDVNLSVKAVKISIVFTADHIHPNMKYCFFSDHKPTAPNNACVQNYQHLKKSKIPALTDRKKKQRMSLYNYLFPFYLISYLVTFILVGPWTSPYMSHNHIRILIF